MSIINQVLKDLDEREPQSTESGRYQSVAEAPPKQGPDYIRLSVWALVIIVVLGAGAYYYWLQQQAESASVIVPVQASVQPQLKIAEPVGTATPVPVVSEYQKSAISVPANTIPAEITPVEITRSVPEPEPSSAEAYLPLKNDDEPVVVTVTAPEKPEQKRKAVEKVSPVKPESKKQDAEILIVKSSKKGISLVKELLETGRLTEAEKHLRDVIRETPNSLAAHELLIGLLLRNNRLDEAKKQLHTARKLYPTNENLVLLKSRILIGEGRIDEVTQLLEELRSKGKAGINTTAMLASLYQQKREFARSLKLYNQLAKAAPANAGYWMGLAVSLDALNDQRQAKDAYTKALQTGGLNSSLGQYARQRITLINQQTIGKQ